jgi:hypothetical protein
MLKLSDISPLHDFGLVCGTGILELPDRNPKRILAVDFAEGITPPPAGSSRTTRDLPLLDIVHSPPRISAETMLSVRVFPYLEEPRGFCGTCAR